MATETELKLALPASARRALLRHPLVTGASALPRKRLLNIYFDTPDLALQRHGVALRLRKQGRQMLQTVKCAGEAAGGLSARPEWEQPCDGLGFDFSAVDDAKLRRWLGRSRIVGRLQALFETRFERRTWRLDPAPGVSILLMLDHGLIASGGRSAALSEVELELVEGGPADLFAVARRLAADLPLVPEPLSKAQRGYLLHADAVPRPQRATPSPITRRHDAVEGARLVALNCIAQLQANEAGAREGRDAEFVHQMRVALRRLRCALRLFDCLLPATAELAQRLSALADTLGEARDWDVLGGEILAPARAACPDDERLRALEAAVAAHGATAAAAARATLATPAYGRLLLDLLALLQGAQPDERVADAPRLTRFARERLRELERKARRRAKAAAGLDVAALHRLRIAVKRWRYALEFFAPLLAGKRVKPVLQRMSRLQEDLGLLNDLANAGTRLARCAGDDGVLREAAAFVTGWHAPRQQRLLARLPADIAALVRPA